MTKKHHPHDRLERIKVRKKYAKPSIRFEDKKEKQEERSSKVWYKLTREELEEREYEDELRQYTRDHSQHI